HAGAAAIAEQGDVAGWLVRAQSEMLKRQKRIDKLIDRRDECGLGLQGQCFPCPLVAGKRAGMRRGGEPALRGAAALENDDGLGGLVRTEKIKESPAVLDILQIDADRFSLRVGEI